MDAYRHHVAGFFASIEDARRVRAELVGDGLDPGRVLMLDAGSAPYGTEPQTQSDNALKSMLADGAVGAAVGTGIGALGELALVAANVSLFVASPIVAPLVMMGWGASLGGFLGAAAGAGSDAVSRSGNFSALIRDAIASGNAVVVAETHTTDETARARAVIEAAVGACAELATP